VSNRQINSPSGFQKDTPLRARLKVDPAVFKSAAVIVSQSKRGLSAAVKARQQTGLDQHLETIADAQNQFAAFDKSRYRIPQMVQYLVGQNLACRHIIAVAEAAGQNKQLIILQQRRFFDYLIDMNSLGFRTGQLQSILGFQIAIDSRRPQYNGTNICHTPAKSFFKFSII